jgi:hypothetical protein
MPTPASGTSPPPSAGRCSMVVDVGPGGCGRQADGDEASMAACKLTCHFRRCHGAERQHRLHYLHSTMLRSTRSGQRLHSRRGPDAAG